MTAVLYLLVATSSPSANELFDFIGFFKNDRVALRELRRHLLGKILTRSRASVAASSLTDGIPSGRVALGVCANDARHLGGYRASRDVELLGKVRWAGYGDTHACESLGIVLTAAPKVMTDAGDEGYSGAVGFVDAGKK